MMSYKTDYEAIRNMIPLYVKGVLSDAEREEVEKAITEHPELQKEVEDWEKIKTAYRSVEEKLPEPSPWLYSKIARRIREKRSLSFFERFMPSPAFSFAVITAQILIIVTLGIYAMNIRTEYRTLSVTSIITEKQVKINVVFKEDATVENIRKLLLQIDGKIIDGPSSSGLYIIGITSKEKLDDGLNTLRKDKIVVLAERTY